ncbi:MAG: hypothetical protein ABIK15_02100 [Pseudomonadota bacterium]
MKQILFLILFMFLTETACFAETKPQFTTDLNKLLTYEVQIFDCVVSKDENNNQKRVDGLLLIDAAPTEVWEVIKDWKSVAELIPDVEYYTTIAALKPIQKGTIGQSFIECKISIPLFDFLFTLDVEFDESRFRQEWQLIKPEDAKIYNLIGIPVKDTTDTIKNMEGFMVAEPFENGKKTVYHFSLTIEFSTVLPEFVESYMIEKLLTDHLKGVKKQVESHGLYAPSRFLKLPF